MLKMTNNTYIIGSRGTSAGAIESYDFNNENKRIKFIKKKYVRVHG